MDNYPSNSNQIKHESGKDNPINAPRHIEKVVEGKVLRQKKPLSRKLTELFVGGDSRTVGSYVLYDVLLPALKDMVADAGSQGLERMLYGEIKSTSRRTGYSRGYNTSRVNYNRLSFSPVGSSNKGRDVLRSPSKRARANHDFDEIILETRVEAEEVIYNLFDLIEKYQSATVRDLYELVGAESHFTDDKWGWVDIRGSGVRRVPRGYLLDLPRPEPLD
jgi:hypothetical protein